MSEVVPGACTKSLYKVSTCRCDKCLLADIAIQARLEELLGKPDEFFKIPIVLHALL